MGSYAAHRPTFDPEANDEAPARPRGARPRGVLHVERNIVYDWANGVEISGGANTDIEDNVTPGCSDLELAHNQLQAIFGRHAVQHSAPLAQFDGAELGLHDNSYHHVDSSTFFRIPKDTARDFADWRGVTGEQSSSVEQLQFRDPTRTAASYSADKLGQSSSFDAFAAALRSRARGAWPCALTAYAVNDYVRQGFVPASSAPESWICD